MSFTAPVLFKHFIHWNTSKAGSTKTTYFKFETKHCMCFQQQL